MDSILLVNDSATLTKVLSSHFQKAGYKVIAVTGAMDAYEAFIRNDVQLILTDLVLKDRDGIEVIETFRAKKGNRALPIVVFTAIDDPKTVQRCKDCGADLVLAGRQAIDGDTAPTWSWPRPTARATSSIASRSSSRTTRRVCPPSRSTTTSETRWSRPPLTSSAR